MRSKQLGLTLMTAFAVGCLAMDSMDDFLSMDLAEGTKVTNCSCGWTNKARIVGGKETIPNEFPLIVGMREKKGGHIFCGGTILTERHVLTAAHCTYPLKRIPSFQAVVVAGEHDQSKAEESKGTQAIDVERMIEHEMYQPKTYLNDISLLVLRNKISFSQTVGPACLPAKRQNLLNEKILALGWGKLGTRKRTSNVLMKVTLSVAPLTKCKKMFTREINVEDATQLCSMGGAKKDSCGGDSGGPLIWLDPEINRYTLVALVSYGKTKCGSGAPAVNTDVSVYTDWIQRKISETNPEMKTCSKV